MSAWEISRAPWMSAGLSGSAGSAARGSHSTRSALCAFAGESTDAMVGASSQMLRAQAIERAPYLFILTMVLRSIFLVSNHIKAASFVLQAQAARRGVLWHQARSHFP